MTYPINRIDPEDENRTEVLSTTLEYDHGQNLIVHAYVKSKKVEGVENEHKFMHSILIDNACKDGGNSSSCSIWGSRWFDSYDDCVIDMNDKLAKSIKERYIIHE